MIGVPAGVFTFGFTSQVSETSSPSLMLASFLPVAVAGTDSVTSEGWPGAAGGAAISLFLLPVLVVVSILFLRFARRAEVA